MISLDKHIQLIEKEISRKINDREASKFLEPFLREMVAKTRVDTSLARREIGEKFVRQYPSKEISNLMKPYSTSIWGNDDRINQTATSQFSSNVSTNKFQITITSNDPALYAQEVLGERASDNNKRNPNNVIPHQISTICKFTEGKDLTNMNTSLFNQKTIKDFKKVIRKHAKGLEERIT